MQATHRAMAAPVTPFANDGSFMAQFLAAQQQQQQQGAGAGALQLQPQIRLATPQQPPQQPALPPGWVPATAPQDMLMQGGTSPSQFDTHNSSLQLIFSDNGAVARRSVGVDPTASKFCFAALVPVADRHGRFAVRLERGVPAASTDGTFRTQEGMFLGVGIARKDRFGAEGFGRGDYSWGLSNRRNEDYPAVFTCSGGIAEKRLPTLKVGDVVSLHWDLDVGAVLMRVNGLHENQHVFKIPSGSPEDYVAGVSLADEHQVRLVAPPEQHLAVRLCAAKEISELNSRDSSRRRDRYGDDRDRDRHRDRDRDRDRDRYREERRERKDSKFDKPPEPAPPAAPSPAAAMLQQMQQMQQLQQLQKMQQVSVL